MTSQEKARTTRENNAEARISLIREQKAAISAARSALTKVLEREDTTPAEVIQAAQLLVELGKH